MAERSTRTASPPWRPSPRQGGGEPRCSVARLGGGPSSHSSVILAVVSPPFSLLLACHPTRVAAHTGGHSHYQTLLLRLCSSCTRLPNRLSIQLQSYPIRPGELNALPSPGPTSAFPNPSSLHLQAHRRAGSHLSQLPAEHLMTATIYEAYNGKLLFSLMPFSHCK